MVAANEYDKTIWATYEKIMIQNLLRVIFVESLNCQYQHFQQGLLAWNINQTVRIHWNYTLMVVGNLVSEFIMLRLRLNQV